MTVKVFDPFTGAAGTDIDLHTPDIDIVGTGWLDGGANTVELDGAGAVKFSANGDSCAIDSGSDDQFITTNYNAGGSDNRISVIGRSDAVPTGTATFYNFNFRPGLGGADNALLFKVVAGASTQLAAITGVYSNSTTYDLKLNVVGTAIECLIDDVSTISTTDSSITTGVYAGLKHALYTNNAARFFDFQVDDGVVGGVTASIRNISFQSIFNSANSLINFLSRDIQKQSSNNTSTLPITSNQEDKQLQKDNSITTIDINLDIANKQYQKDLSNAFLVNVINVNNIDKQLQKDNSLVNSTVDSIITDNDFSIDRVSTQVVNISNISDKQLQSSNSVTSSSVSSNSSDIQQQKDRVLAFLANVIISNNKDKQFQKETSFANVVNSISVSNTDKQLQKDKSSASLEVVFTANIKDIQLQRDSSNVYLVSAVRVSNQEFQNSYSNITSTRSTSNKDSSIQLSLSEASSSVSLNISNKQLNKESSRLFLDLVQGIGEGEFVIGNLSDGSFLIGSLSDGNLIIK